MWEYPDEPWRRVHIDFLGPFRGKMYLVIEDAFSKWIEVFKMNSTKCHNVVEKMYEVFARFGLPDYVISDNGPPFKSNEFEAFLSRNGIVHKTSPPYYPQCNGQAESAVKIVKSFLKKMPDDNKLQRFLFDYRISKHTTTDKSPAELLQNRVLKTRFDLIRPNNKVETLPKETSAIGEENCDHNDKVQFMKTFNEGDIVWVRDYKTSNPKWTNGVVQKKIGNVIYLVRVGDQVWKRHADQMMKFKGERRDVTVHELETPRYVYSTASDDMLSEPSDADYETCESESNAEFESDESDEEEQVVSVQDEERRYPKRLNRRPPPHYQ